MWFDLSRDVKRNMKHQRASAAVFVLGARRHKAKTIKTDNIKKEKVKRRGDDEELRSGEKQ